MSPILNQISSTWYNTMLLFELQNSLFIVIVLVILFLLKKAPASIKKSLIFIGIIKTLVPPVFDLYSMPSQSLFFPYTFSTAENVAKVSSATPGIPENAITFQSWLFLFWLLGMLGLALIIFRDQLRLRNLIFSGKPISCKFPGINKTINFFINKKVTNPVVFGLIKPKVLLPGNWESLEPTLQRSIILHELSHIKAKDIFWNHLKLLSLMLHFFNPLNWLLVFLCDLYMEMVCDDLTLESSKLPSKHYIKNILTVAESMSAVDYCATRINFSSAFKLLKYRITYQLNKEELKMKKFKMIGKIVPFILALLIIPLSWQCNNSDESAIQEPVVSPSTNSDFKIVNNTYPFYMADEKPKMLHKEKPVYPEEARRNGISGLVIITVTIDEQGNVIEAVPLVEVPVKDDAGNIVRMQKVNRHPELEPAAVQAALKCKFKPAKINGEPIKVKMNVPFRFKLH